MNKRTTLCALLASAMLTCSAQNAATTITPTRPGSQQIPALPTMPYQPTVGKLAIGSTMAMPRHEEEADLQADFSIQGGQSQVEVWSENFDTDLSQWDINNEVKDGWGPITVELASTSSKKVPFNTYDADDVTSLHIEGDYRVSKRNMAYVTSGDIAVPQNAILHAFVGYSEWEECALFITVSTDNFETETELWNSMNCGITGWHWQEINSDLSPFAGQTIKLRLTYGEGTKNNYGVGGYMGDFYVDGLSITGVQSVQEVSVKTGDIIQMADLSMGNIARWEWLFPGGTPAESTDQNPTVHYEKAGEYDVTLNVYDADEQMASITKLGFVKVEGQEPVAGIEFPAGFRDLNTRMRMVAPFAEVEYKDASAGFPDQYSWTFYTPYDLEHGGAFFQPDTIYTTRDVKVRHERLDKNYVLHIAQNDLGYAYVEDSVSVKFDALVTNFLPTDGYQTNFVDGDLTMPGANKMGITAWAERFSKPSVPVVLEGMYVNFTKATPGDDLMNQIASVDFSLYTSENGLPGEPIALLDSWTMTELNYAMTTNSGIVTVELSAPIVIDQEVFVVIDGIPEKADDLECAIAMAPLRSEGNTAYMLNKGTWRPFTGYFDAAPGGQTSLAVFPYYRHSVVVPAAFEEIELDGGLSQQRIIVGADSTTVSQEAGQAEVYVFANRGLQTYQQPSEEWLRIVGKPGEYTVDTLTVEYDALPEGIDRREATLIVSDGITTLPLRFIQQRVDIPEPTGINAVEPEARSQEREVYDLQGRRQPDGIIGRGIYVVRKGKDSYKLLK